MPDVNVVVEKVLWALIWLLPGLLVLLAIILVLSYTDRRPRRDEPAEPRPGDNDDADKQG